MSTCNLCQSRPADKRNSHIIPRFMCKRLFENASPRHTVQLAQDSSVLKLQDVPKEDHIICKQCEHRFEIIETYFSKVFIEINSLHSARRDYKLESVYQHELLWCNDIQPSLFYLFLYSLIWRCAISKNPIFDSFTIEKNIQEEIRLFLDTNLKHSHSELLQNAKHIEDIPNKYLCLIKPKNKTRGIFTGYCFGPNSYAIYTVDYALFYYTKEENCPISHKTFGNFKNEIFKIVIEDDTNWRNLNRLVVKNMLNQNGS